MNTKFLATTAMVLIGLSGAAWAQQTTPTGKPDQAAETTNQELMLGETATEQPLTGEDADTADTAGSADTTTPAAGMATETSSERLRSYSTTTTTAPFTGSVVGGMSADTLIGMSVVDNNGKSVGKVSDLIIGRNDVVHHAVVEVGGILGFGAKTTAIDLEHATVDQSKSEVTLDLSRAEIDAMPEYQKDDDGWFAG
jgi:sporulation protein YlmC with PRC-barrel domain